MEKVPDVAAEVLQSSLGFSRKSLYCQNLIENPKTLFLDLPQKANPAPNGIIRTKLHGDLAIMPLSRLPLPPPPPGKLLQLPGRLLPPGVHATGLAFLLNRLFAGPLARDELWFLRNRVLQVEVTDLALDYRITLRQGRLTAASPARRPDVRFGGTLREFLVLTLGKEDPDTLFFQRRLQLEGDTELGLEIKNFLYSLEQGLLPAPLERLLTQLV